jgi:hypothetical protein
MSQDLQKTVPAVGIVLDCCTKPSHDLGRQAHFDSVFGEMIGYLSRQGVKQVLVACPNCFKIFQHHGNGITVQTVYNSSTQTDSRQAPQTQLERSAYTIPVRCAMRSRCIKPSAVCSPNWD